MGGSAWKLTKRFSGKQGQPPDPRERHNQHRELSYPANVSVTANPREEHQNAGNR
jgi:hypothetical protein